MPIYPYSFQLPPLNVQDIPNDGVAGEFLGISAGGVLDWLPVSAGGGDMLKSENLSGLADYPTARTNLGLGTGDSPTFKNLTISTGTITTSAPVTISQTWDALAVAFTAFKVNATSTNSAAASLLLDLQTGGVSKFRVDKNGFINVAYAADRVFRTFSGANGFNLKAGPFSENNLIIERGDAAPMAAFNSTGFTCVSELRFAISIGTFNVDTILLRDGAPNTLALRNSTAAQTFRVYGSYPDTGINYARLALSCDTSGNATISTQALGTFTAGTVSINGVTVGRGTANLSGNISIGGGLNAATGTGIGNIALGSGTLTNVTVGPQNIAIGTNALYFQTIWGYNIGIGLEALHLSNTNAQANVGIGVGALYHNQTGSNSVAVGIQAGRSTPAGNNTGAVNNSVFIGALTKALAAGQENQIVIGYDATGLGSNTAVLGNASITTTALRGNVGIGTTAPGAPLHVQGTAITGRESIIKASVSDDATSAFHLYNATSANFKFVPGFSGAVFDNTAFTCMLFAGQTNAANDTGTNPMVVFAARTTDSTSDPNNGTLAAVANRPLFSWQNLATPQMQMSANGNLGIGTTSPSSKLHVVGDAVLTGDLLGTNYTIGVPTILTQSNISITNIHSGVVDSAFVITPKGLGAFILGPKPDGTVTGGNARGFYAVDLQIYRSGNTSVASGNFSSLLGGVNNRASAQYSFVAGGTANIGSGSHSTVCGGEANTASSNYSVVVGGSVNTASGLSSFIGGGNNGLADRYCLSAQASGRFAANGDAQKTTAVFRNKTTTNSAVELFLDGASARYTVTSGKVISMLINITGTKSDGSAVAHYVRQYSIKNVGGTTSEVYAAVTVGTDNAAGTSIALSADNTNDSLKIEVTGVASETWRWVASVDAVEVGYGV